MKIKIKKYQLIFKKPAGTSRGVLNVKDTWFIQLIDEKSGTTGVGEINMFKGLSCDDRPDFEVRLKDVVKNLNLYLDDFHNSLAEFPSIRFGLEMALKDLGIKKPYVLFENDFSWGKSGIPINGLIWMGDIDFMKSQIKDKLEKGFRCLKMKIGALNFDEEYEVLKKIRKEYSESDLELRVDANGAFVFDEAFTKLEKLAKLNLHSIEQPIKQGNWIQMEELCKTTPLPIALDEELIGVHSSQKRKHLIDQVKPQYIILKPALIGGYQSSEEWIRLAEERNIDWWLTSALESNIGLNAIAQWTASLNTNRYQGLGTGQLYTNNIESPLKIEGEQLFYKPEKNWQDLSFHDKVF